MEFSEEELAEFMVESGELLDTAESALLAVSHGEDFGQHYDSIFRVFHSLKGAGGMMELLKLQAHMHRLENKLIERKGDQPFARAQIEFFLRGVDGARDLLRGKEIDFEYEILPEPHPSLPMEETLTNQAGEPSALAEPPSLSSPLPLCNNAAQLPQAQTSTLQQVGFIELGSAEQFWVLEQLPVGWELRGLDSPDSSSNPQAHALRAILLGPLDPRNLLSALAHIKANWPLTPIIALTDSEHQAGWDQLIPSDIFGVIQLPAPNPPLDSVQSAPPARFKQLLQQAACLARARGYASRVFHRFLHHYVDLDDHFLTLGDTAAREDLRSEFEALLELQRDLH